jgi:hypothetical protein
MPEIAFSSVGNVADPGVWSQIHNEGVHLLENIANIRVPVVAAIEGRAHAQSEHALLANMIVAGEGATFHDCPALRANHCAGRRNFYRVALSRWSGASGNVPGQPTAAHGANRARMGSDCRGCAERYGAAPSTGIGQVVLEGSRSDPPQ